MKVTFSLPGDNDILGYKTDRLEANIVQHDVDIAELRRCIEMHEQETIILRNIIARKEMLERARDDHT